ncbi:MAG: hypothetical protein RDU89_02100 [bacterium]|nr:hypothetical protein [bacterium]
MSGLGRWVLYRLAGLALLPLIVLHLWAWHAPGAPPTAFAPARARLETTSAMAVALLLLSLTIFHGLTGLGNVLGDWWRLDRPGERRLAVALGTAGVLLWILGAWGLFAFRRR